MNAAQHDVARFATQAAVACVAEAKRQVQLKHYVQVVKQLPAVVHRHGLGQALTWLRVQSGGKANSPYAVLGRQIDAWLLQVAGVSERTALDALTKRDTQFYLQMAAQIAIFLRALRAQVEGES